MRLVKQYSPRTAISGVGWIHVDARQAGAVFKRLRRDARDAGGNVHARQAATAVKRAFSDARDAGRYVHAGYARVAKRIITDLGDAGGDGVTSAHTLGELDQGRKRLVEQYSARTAISRVGWIHSDARQAVAAVKHEFSDARDAAGDFHAGYAVFVGIKRKILDAGDGISIGRGGNIHVTAPDITGDGDGIVIGGES